METRKNMPEEVKNEIVDGKKRVVTVALPEKQQKIIAEKKQKKQALIRKYLQVSFNVTRGQKDMQKIFDEISEIEQSIGSRIQDGFKKLKLQKKKDRQWRYDGRDSFIGVLNPPKSDAPSK